ncbi:hypothetical protein NpPPO83_00009563 [Neofusicoccum parvum]|uniref:Uncharacterized protein n=1 Tax=Neofusicoccum parvum TaxID=310453 RepID=A0ACB5SDR3_9PEZI|nr:hypothetical protein NpPPO83_00009563 [Neofusicoccum parvum]
MVPQMARVLWYMNPSDTIDSCLLSQIPASKGFLRQFFLRLEFLSKHSHRVSSPSQVFSGKDYSSQVPISQVLISQAPSRQFLTRSFPSSRTLSSKVSLDQALAYHITSSHAPFSKASSRQVRFIQFLRSQVLYSKVWLG